LIDFSKKLGIVKTGKNRAKFQNRAKTGHLPGNRVILVYLVANNILN
jgi:hypothetical protein